MVSIAELVQHFGRAKTTYQNRAIQDRKVPPAMRKVLECGGGYGTTVKRFCFIWTAIKWNDNVVLIK